MEWRRCWTTACCVFLTGCGALGDTAATLNCGAAHTCELSADSAAMSVLSTYDDPEAQRAMDGPERYRLGNDYADLVLAGRIVRLPAGTRVRELRRDPPNVSATPRYSVVQVLEGDFVGRELIAPVEFVKAGR